MLESGHLDFAAPRAYYGGCFYVAEALLLDEGSSFSRHGSLIGEYGRLFVKTGRLDRRFHTAEFMSIDPMTRSRSARTIPSRPPA